MNKEQLSEKYYHILNEGWWDVVKTVIGPALGIGAAAAGGYAAYEGLSGLPEFLKSLASAQQETAGSNRTMSNIYSSSGSKRNPISTQKNIEKNEALQARRKELKDLQTKVKQKMAELRASGNSGDEVALRKAAIENLSQDKDFVARANKQGFTVGRVSGSENGMFGYRYANSGEAQAVSDASRQHLFDAQGRAKVFEKDPNTGKLVGRNPTEQEVADREQRMSAPAEEKPSRPRFSVGRGSHGQPVIIRKYDWEKNPPITNVDGRYVNPLTPEGRLINQGWTKGSDGEWIPPAEIPTSPGGNGTGRTPPRPSSRPSSRPPSRPPSRPSRRDTSPPPESPF